MSSTSPVRPAPPIEVQLLEAPFQPLERLAAWQRHLAADEPDATGSAAESHFIGRVRPTTAAGAPLEALELEHYPGMTEAQLGALAEASAVRHGAGAVLVAHRVGWVRPGEAIVLVAVQADRRGPALRCVQELLEDLKHHAPFWKREWSGGRGTWVAGNTPL
ncbi:molybdenum cofactor biosynthesis protein MoaE [Cyanobium gracile UHCC 0139]|uniref:Molybdenum cofactor biosynthesis protein MoaE n=1 Tax=Cyanobium gracile UHCC 0139 TaxID=3110308 RepID=A0ABU5RQM4_9CYAN|nr:molybdenum cofactor biosynthesis protein MoaE [Cyanobium gracile]MEA5390064.1 molybdenum cofactor biosynthesis protein MoaE [Cyanobium gracile UHCC 0139]